MVEVLTTFRTFWDLPLACLVDCGVDGPSIQVAPTPLPEWSPSEDELEELVKIIASIFREGLKENVFTRR